MSTSKPKQQKAPTKAHNAPATDNLDFIDHLESSRPKPKTAHDRKLESIPSGNEPPVSRKALRTPTQNALQELKEAQVNVGSALKAADSVLQAAEDALHQEVEDYIQHRSDITESYVNPLGIAARVVTTAVTKAADSLTVLNEQEFTFQDLFNGMLPGKEELELPMLEESKEIKFQLPPVFRSPSSERGAQQPYTSSLQPALPSTSSFSTDSERFNEESCRTQGLEEQTQKPSTSNPPKHSESGDTTELW